MEFFVNVLLSFFIIQRDMARCFRHSRSETEKRASHSSSLGRRREYAEEKDTTLKRTGLPFRDAYKDIRAVPIIWQMYRDIS